MAENGPIRIENRNYEPITSPSLNSPFSLHTGTRDTARLLLDLLATGGTHRLARTVHHAPPLRLPREMMRP